MNAKAAGPTAPGVPHRAVVALFAATTFTASALLFLVQPMFAKMVLPRLGGSAAVWNTCVLFFQSALLLGYLYAHLSVRQLGARSQSLAHAGLMLLPLPILPLAIGNSSPGPGASPLWWLLGIMTLSVGPGFLAVSTMAPLVQRWLATLPLPRSADPYFLYAASNLGSLLGLVAYPFLIEPAIGVRTQTVAWASGYVALIILAAACAGIVRRFGSDAAGPARPAAGALVEPGGRDRAWWAALAFVPSSLMLGVTAHITTDLAAVPLLWVLPLVLYLASFVIAFSPAGPGCSAVAARALPLLALLSVIAATLRFTSLGFIPVHLAAFAACAVSCHGQLAARRPAVAHLTEFYLWLSVGGMLGGAFNTLIAPQVFSGTFEYPLALVLACVLRPRAGGGSLEPWPYFAATLVVPVALCAGLWKVGLVGAGAGPAAVVLIAAAASGTAWSFARRHLPFDLLLAAFVALIVGGFGVPGDVLFAGRSFYGVLRVLRAPDPPSHVLVHGTTIHGGQDMSDPARCEPSAYFHRAGPIGQVFARAGARFDRVAVVGLGSGAMACYAEAHRRMTFFELDPLVARVATDPALFTYLRNARGRVDVAIGDGRKRLEEAEPATYDLIVLDAFSSDAVPAHLLTREALRTYVTRLRPGGLVAFHVTNRYLDLMSVVGAAAGAEGLFALASEDRVDAGQRRHGRLPSRWVVIAASEPPLQPLRSLGSWQTLSAPPGTRPWTDDYSNLLGSVRWRAPAR